MSFPYLPAPSSASPGLAIPSSDWLNQHDGNTVITTSAVFLVLCTVFVSLRFWARRLVGAPLGVDDYTIYPALVCTWGFQVLCIVIVPVGGLGTRAAYWELLGEADRLETFGQLLYATEMVGLLGMALTKLAILAIFLRVLRDPWSLRIAYLCVTVTIATAIAALVACSLQCQPLAFLWDISMANGQCFDQKRFFQFVSFPNILTDVALLLLPIRTIVHLHISVRQKLQLAAAFATGSVGIFASCLRFTSFINNDDDDPTYDTAGLLLWSMIEISVYLICACLPVLRPLFDRTTDRTRPTSTTSASYANNNSQKRFTASYNQSPLSKHAYNDSQSDGVTPTGGYYATETADSSADRGNCLPTNTPYGQKTIMQTQEIHIDRSDAIV